MNLYRRITIIAGTLYIFGTIAGILSVVPAIDAPDYLIKAVENANQVRFGAFFQFIMTIAYAGVAIILYPVLRKYKENLALGFLSFRIIAAVLNIIGFIILLSILALSQEFVKAGGQDQSFFQNAGSLLRTLRDLVNHVAMILSVSVGGLMFYALLFQTKLVPRWLSCWGFCGTVFTILASLLIMVHIIDIITPVYLILNLPLILLELVLAIWLIAKGFDPKITGSFN